ncbi:MAG: hypothetical protein HYU02_03160 [Thaumarchaeota archaeon]|nr:hypothetical protein [Nitrososphaerota archaeon]
MRIPIIVVGTVIALAGAVFWLQGLSIVGPTTSFMYRNPEWINNGLVILTVGVVVIIAGIITRRSKKP